MTPNLLLRRRQARELHCWLRAMRRAWQTPLADVPLNEVDPVMAARLAARDRLHEIAGEGEV